MKALILITNCLPDDNPGGLALLSGILTTLQANYPGCECNLLSLYSSTDKRTETAYRHTKKRFPNIKIYGALIKHRTEYNITNNTLINKIYKLIFWPLDILLSMLYLMVPGFSSNRETLDAFKRADVIVSRGSHIIYDNPKKKIPSILGIWTTLYPLLIAKRLNKKYIMYGHSFSPLSISFNKLLFKYCMKSCHKILVREEISKATLVNYYAIDEKKIEVVPDPAFAIEKPPVEYVRNVISRWELPLHDYVVVTVVDWPIGKEARERYLTGMAQIIDWLISKKIVFKCALLIQVKKGPANWEDDSKMTYALYDRLKNKEQTIILEHDWIPEELISIFTAAKISLPTRYHSLIFSLIGNTPPLAISFSGPKKKGVMKIFNLQDYVMDQGNFDFDVARTKISRLLDTRDNIVDSIKQVSNSLRCTSYEIARYVLE